MCFKGRQESRKKKSVIKKQQKERGMIETTRWDYLKHLQLPRSVRKLETAPMGHTKISFIFFFFSVEMHLAGLQYCTPTHCTILHGKTNIKDKTQTKTQLNQTKTCRF